MKFSTPLILAATASAAPHYTFPKIAGTSDWQVVRQAANFQSNGPVTNVNSNDIRCFQLRQGGGGSTSNYPIKAGSSLTYQSNQAIFHPGPLSAYMAKVPSGQTAASWDGSGAVWFKIYQEQAQSQGGQLSWASINKSSFSFNIPQCLANGDYLFRIEHVALHSAGTPQFYISCAQLTVSGGSGSKTPSNLVAFPGAYKASDPGLSVNIYNSGGRYTPAGPAVFTC